MSYANGNISITKLFISAENPICIIYDNLLEAEKVPAQKGIIIGDKVILLVLENKRQML